MTLEEQINLGQGADALLRDTSVQAVIQKIQAECFERWKSLPRDQADAIRYTALALDQIIERLGTIRDNGLVAQSQLQR